MRGLRPGLSCCASSHGCAASRPFGLQSLSPAHLARQALRAPLASGLSACAAACRPPCRPCASWVCSSPSGWPLSALVAYPPLGLCRQGAFAAYAHSLRSLRYSTVPMTAAQLRVVGAYRDQPKADEQIHRGRFTLQGKSGAAPASRARFMFTSRSHLGI